jgi:ribonuclease D
LQLAVRLASTQDFEKFCDTLQCEGEGVISIDTEFVRTQTYYPELCLIQLAFQGTICLLDPLDKALDLQRLCSFLESSSYVKVLHAAQQDLDALQFFFKGVRLSNVFDTQIALLLTTDSPPLSYEKAVQQLVGDVTLQKEFQRVCWSKRPLPEDWLEYAMQDVRYLTEMYETLLQQLRQKGRSLWMDEEMAALQNTPPKEPWRLLKNVGRLLPHLTPQTFGYLKALCKWREAEAQKQNKTRGGILRDEKIFAIFQKKNTSFDEILSALPPKVRDILTDLLRTAPSTPVPSMGPLEPAIKKKVEALRVRAQAVAEAAGLHPAFFMTRRDLEKYAAGTPTARFQKGTWRERLLYSRSFII